MGEKSIEVKVGALILVALGLLVVFVLVLGRVTTKEGFNLDVLFVHPGALNPGAPVKIAGSEVGYVESMTYLGTDGPFAPPNENTPPGTPPQRTRVKVRVWLEERVRESIRQDATYYVTQQGLLGESFLEIGPGAAGGAVQDGGSVFGTDPPRLDEALANGANSLETINRMLRRNEKQIDDLITSAASAMKTIDGVLSRNERELDDVVAHADELLVEGRDTVKGVRQKYVDNPRIDRVLTNLDGTTTLLARHDEELINDLDSTMDLARDVLDTIGPEQRVQIRAVIADAREISGTFRGTATDVDAVVARVRRGEGTVGALLMDEEVYDDLKELLRDLKHNPWKFFWRE
jgi:phospholipid/cholesterol/gamma-HCH transport system substrate-binding protein